MKIIHYHKKFQLNNHSFSSVDDLLKFSKTISKITHQFLKDWFSKKEFILVNTSGSTGEPKSIKLQKKQMLNSALATGSFFDLKENTSALLCLPVEYIAGKMMLVRAMILGWNLEVILPTSHPLEKTEKSYDFSAMIPLQLENSLDKLHKIKKLIVGGASVSGLLKEKLQKYPTSVFATYGMSETSTHIAVKKLNHLDRFPNFYQILQGITIYKEDRNCIVIEAKKLSKQIIFTNDVVELISDTQFKWLGRFDNVINSGGIKLHPEKIEQKLSAIIRERFFVAGIPDDKLGEKLILIIESANSKKEKKRKYEFKIKRSELLSKFEIPKEIYFIKKFKETKIKKIQRKKTLDLI